MTAVDGLEASVQKMRREGIPDAAINTFEHYYRQLAEGATGMLPEAEIEPVDELQDLESLPDEEAPLDQAMASSLSMRRGLKSPSRPDTISTMSTFAARTCSSASASPGACG